MDVAPDVSPARSSIPDSQEELETEQPAPIDDSAQEALKDADDDFVALEQVADLEPTTTSGMEPSGTGMPGGLSPTSVAYSADDGLKVRRVFPVGKALVALVMAASVYGQINVYGVTTKSERCERSYRTRSAAGNGIGGREAPVPYGS